MRLFILVFLLIYSHCANTQIIVRSSINSLGNVRVNQKISLSQTIGQSANFSVFTQHNVQLRQGFQQANQGVNSKTKNNQLQFSIYPNPNHGKFTVLFKERVSEKMSFRLVDNLGRVCKEDVILVNGQKCNFIFKLPSGVYFLQIKNKEGNSGIKKIVILH